MYIIFWYNHGIVLCHPMPEGKTDNGQLYLETFCNHLFPAIDRFPQFSDGFILHQDNAPARRAWMMHNFLLESRNEMHVHLIKLEYCFYWQLFREMQINTFGTFGPLVHNLSQKFRDIRNFRPLSRLEQKLSQLKKVKLTSVPMSPDEVIKSNYMHSGFGTFITCGKYCIL